MDNAPATAQAAKRLIELLGPAKVIQLVELIEEVAKDTGYGDVKIVISEGGAYRLKAEKSYW